MESVVSEEKPTYHGRDYIEAVMEYNKRRPDLPWTCPTCQHMYRGDNLIEHYKECKRVDTTVSTDGWFSRALLGEDHVKEFLDDKWPTHLMTHSGDPARFEFLLTIPDLSSAGCCSIECQYIKAFRVVRGEALIGRRTESLDGVRPWETADLYNKGFTLYWHRLRHPEIDALCARLELELGLVEARVSAFASKERKGLLWHYDNNENFSLQLRGEKDWFFHDSARTVSPTMGYTLGLPLDAHQTVEVSQATRELRTPYPMRRVATKPGDAHFLPRGLWHNATTIKDSFHVNIQMSCVTGRDLLEYLIVEHPSILKFKSVRDWVRPLGDGKRVIARTSIFAMLEEIAQGLSSEDLEISMPALRRYIRKRREERPERL